MTVPLQQRYHDLQVAHATGQLGGGARSSPDDPFILKLAHLVLSYGLEVNASDIHIEPTTAGVRIRYRVDGLLHEMLQLPPDTRDVLIRALKVKANMATEVVGRSKPQDGRLDFTTDERGIDLRLSSFPTLFGDVLAIRILDRSASLLELERLGLSPAIYKTFDRLIRRPNGMLLVTGPAGSGKTTTLYAALNRIRSPHSKIVTLEDPIEYQVDGIDQAQVNPTAGLTFAAGLRAILRQDANVIFVGEIRDKETAEIATRAALTGHLVFSTMHTRNALGAATRLMDMGIEPHLIAASLTAVMAQRLVRVLCPACTVHDPRSKAVFRSVWTRQTDEPPPPEHKLERLSTARGCPACNLTGYQGRTGIFELLVLDEDTERLMLGRAAGQAVATDGARPLRTMPLHGLEKAAAGVTTIAEVLRVTGDADTV
jgi:type II secretory ATPase GspE/PulE/Tfp pilus assembly ATPase PilB-like protein